jgi:phage repressor protein C with HTH and peptisase S24 domain
MTTDAGTRLREAIEQRGFIDAATFARRVLEKPGTVRAQINRGSIPKKAAEKYARRLNVPVQWLLYGTGPSPFEADDREEPPEHEPPAAKIVEIEGEEFAALIRWDMRMSAGPGSVAPGMPEPMHRVLFRLDWIRRVTATPIDHLIVLDVDGDSMEPTLRSGDNCLVDLRQRAPGRRDGLYGINRDGELQVKRVAAHPVTGLLTISSDNPAYPRWVDILPGSIDIIGRVIWIGRQL